MEIGSNVSFEDLQGEVNGFEKSHNLRADDAFIVWFLRAYILDDEARAVEALTGDSDERAIDAIHIDDSAKVVHIVQGKFHGKIGKHTDAAASVDQFTAWARRLYGPQTQFTQAITGIDPSAVKKLKQARDRLVTRTGYRLVMYWVTTGRATPSTVKTAEQDVRAQGIGTGHRARFEIIEGKRVLNLLYDYLYGVAPVVPVLELPVASDIVRTKDPKTNIVLRVFEMKGDDLAQLVDEASVRLFALNIRGYLRETVVNENMKVTLRKAPQNFLYFNNGVTFVCDNATFEDPDANDRLTLINPQIINGQQTTRVLHEVDRKIAGRAMVVVRVIVIPRGSTGRRQEALISNVVQATNWQNSIKLSDLRSNDLQQVRIERGFRQLGTYHYSRKKQPKRDVKAEVGKGVRIIGRDDLAKAVAGCRIESSPLRGIEALFSEYYDDIFNNYPMKYYLACYWLWLRVRSYASRESDSVERKRGIWLGLYRLNQELEPTIKKRYDIFIRLSERATEFPQLAALVGVLADTMIASCARFYRTYKGVDGYGADPTNFFKTKDLDDLFSTFWVDPKNASLRIKFEKALARFEKGFAEAELA